MDSGYDEIGFVLAVLVLAVCLLVGTLVWEFISEWRDR